MMHLKTILMRARVMADIEIGDEFYNTKFPNITMVVKAIDRKKYKISALNSLGQMLKIDPIRIANFYTKKGKSP